MSVVVISALSAIFVDHLIWILFSVAAVMNRRNLSCLPRRIISLGEMSPSNGFFAWNHAAVFSRSPENCLATKLMVEAISGK